MCAVQESCNDWETKVTRSERSQMMNGEENTEENNEDQHCKYVDLTPDSDDRSNCAYYPVEQKVNLKHHLRGRK